ncbi:MAG TPA: iron-containing alcohol dehydrogenase [Accumulibacter sp.]|jgi:alcohol dehydrogenase class IV|nr:iron-containing alcohol dehydrogenase [Accumulibacter sp.]
MNIETFFNNDEAKRFFFPGKVFIGSGVAERAAELISQYNSIAIVVDRAFSNSLLYERLIEAGKEGGLVTWVVQGAPYAQDIVEFIGRMGEIPDVVVSIGGGSAADFAKSIILHALFGTIDGIGVGNKLGLEPKAGAKRPTYIAIPTTAGSGAEASRYFVTYDKHTHGKVYGKTWQIVADWIFLDPKYLAAMPESTLAACAFDAFLHFFETFVAKHERSSFGEMFSLDGIPRIMKALDDAINHGERNAKTHEELLYAATLAGMAISNVRTGNIHEAAGALLELTELSHPETLFVFFRDAVEQYVKAIEDRENLLLSHLRLLPVFAEFSSLEDVVLWWEKIFLKTGLDARIRKAIAELKPSSYKVHDHVFQRVYSDKVWINKESPLPLDEKEIRRFIERSLNRFGLSV